MSEKSNNDVKNIILLNYRTLCINCFPGTDDSKYPAMLYNNHGCIYHNE